MKKVFKIFFAAALIMALLCPLISCTSSDKTNATGGEFAPNYSNGSSDKIEIGTDEILDASLKERKIIKNVNETVQTDRFDEFIDALREAINEAGGYVSTREERGESYYNKSSLRYSYFVIRIPADALDGFTQSVDNLGVVTSYRESATDVTEAYIDIESRIAVLEAEEGALISILEKASTVADALAVRSNVLEVQSELASLRAQKKSYDDKTAYSTVYMNVHEVRRATEANPTFFEEVGGNFSDNLYEIGAGLRSFGVWLLGDSIYIILVLLFAGAVTLVTVFTVKRFGGGALGKKKDGDTHS